MRAYGEPQIGVGRRLPRAVDIYIEAWKVTE
jgi:hypothetical protein